MIKVNLVPADILAKARQRQIMFQAAIAGGALAVVLLLASCAHWYGLYRLQNDYKYKEAKLKQLSVIIAQVEELEKAADAVRARLGVIESLLKGRAYYPVFMSEFAGTVPPGVQVNALTTSMQPNNALKLSISASASRGDDVAAWLRTLQSAPRFSAVELGPMSAGGSRQYSFTIVAVYTLKL